MMPLWWGLPLVLALAGCSRGHGDDRAEGHGHGHGHGDAPAEEPEPLAITRWTERYELFVEFPPPVPDKPVRYHAHVTRLSDFHAVTEGRFTVRFKKEVQIAAKATIEGVARPGIFTPEGPAPGAGSYALEMAYELGGKVDVFDCGTIAVATTSPADEGPPGGAIGFLKESQWKIPFGTAWAGDRAMAREIELPATVEPAAGDQLTIAAATGGRFFHNPKLALAEGRTIGKGDVVGTIAPTVAGDDFSRLQFAVDDARLARQHTRSEIDRVKPLVEQGLLPRRRLIELERELARQDAALRAASRRLARVVAPGGAGGLVIRSSRAGVISRILVQNGEPVEPGKALLRLGGTDQPWIRSRFVARDDLELDGAQPAAIRLSSGRRVELSQGRARFLSKLPAIDPATRIASWVVELTPPATGAKPRPSGGDVRVGTSVVLSVRIGKPRTVLAVPVGAVVDINTRDYVFVQVDGESFDKRAVTIGYRDGGFVEVLSGIRKGDRIVTTGGFDVHLASLMGAVESHRH